MEGLTHIVLTRFAIRGLFPKALPDPHEAARIAHRLALLRMGCLPSLLGQTVDNAHWLVAVDADLPVAARGCLAVLVERHPRGRVDADAEGYARGFGRLVARHVPPGTRWLLTTLLDDDDALHAGVLADLQAQIVEAVTRNEMPPLRFFGLEQAVQWDLVAAAGAPLGYAKPWTRRDFAGRPFPVSAGFSVCEAWPGAGIGPSAISHAAIKNVCRLDDDRILQRPGLGERVLRARALVREAMQRLGHHDDAVLSLARHYRQCTLAAPQCLMSNHAGNAEQTRRDEGHDLRQPVVRDRSFPGIPVDYEAAIEAMARGAGA